jgi:hypothetical protein
MKRSVVLAACLVVASLGLWFGLRVKRETPRDVGKNASTARKYKNFRVSIYVVVNSTNRLADPATRDQEFARVSSQLEFDKVYLEVYRNKLFARGEAIESVKQFFESRGIEVAGGITLAAGGQGGQFGTFDYEKPEDRAECKRAVELAASHFDEVILDDFFFYTSKSDADIAAKGTRSWTQYRLDTMRDVAANLVLKPARAANPRITMIIKYPNWYEHFQGLGYDLDKEARMFDAIYTGTETRDPYVTDQLLQQYESYEIFRYLSNIRPDGRNLGGWVDTYGVRYVDRYAEELWLTLFAKAPEITLFNWIDMAGPKAVEPGDRKAWEDGKTSFRWSEMVKSYSPADKDAAGPGWAHVAGYSLEQVDAVIGKLGKPIGVASYKPYQSTGEDFLHNYLGNIGLPIELTPTFPDDSSAIVLTESAKFDPDIIVKIKRRLASGRSVVITSGFLQAMQGKGIEDIVEWQVTGRTVLVHDFINGFGAGNGTSLNDPKRDNPAVLLPEVHFFTNDSWPIIRGVAGAKGFPVMLMNRYSNGVIYLLAVPENIGDLYNLPRPLITQIKRYLQPDFPVRIDSPVPMSLFAYDNKTFVVESFLAEEAQVSLSIAGVDAKVRNIVTGEMVTADPLPPSSKMPEEAKSRTGESPRTGFSVKIEPHSYQAYEVVP